MLKIIAPHKALGSHVRTTCAMNKQVLLSSATTKGSTENTPREKARFLSGYILPKATAQEDSHVWETL